MAFRFSVLASGSSGNAAFLETDNFGLLIDAGLGPRQLAARLAAVGASWNSVRAVLLTHTHGDHWKDRTLKQLAQYRIPFYCHQNHHQVLREFGPSFTELINADLVRCYDGTKELQLSPTLRCRPLEVQHDSHPTFGFRIEGLGGSSESQWAVGYAADLGCWTSELAMQLANADLLALEFNHDEKLERSSRRPPELIERVLGDTGHLSNVQAAEFLRAILNCSAPGVTRHVVQLHLSRECNRPALARHAARFALGDAEKSVAIHTAEQDRVGPVLSLEQTQSSARGVPCQRTAVPLLRPRLVQRCLPGMADTPG